MRPRTQTAMFLITAVSAAAAALRSRVSRGRFVGRQFGPYRKCVGHLRQGRSDREIRVTPR